MNPITFTLRASVFKRADFKRVLASAGRRHEDETPPGIERRRQRGRRITRFVRRVGGHAELDRRVDVKM